MATFNDRGDYAKREPRYGRRSAASRQAQAQAMPLPACQVPCQANVVDGGGRRAVPSGFSHCVLASVGFDHILSLLHPSFTHPSPSRPRAQRLPARHPFDCYEQSVPPPPSVPRSNVIMIFHLSALFFVVLVVARECARPLPSLLWDISCFSTGVVRANSQSRGTSASASSPSRRRTCPRSW